MHILGDVLSLPFLLSAYLVASTFRRRSDVIQRPLQLRRRALRKARLQPSFTSPLCLFRIFPPLLHPLRVERRPLHRVSLRCYRRFPFLLLLPPCALEAVRLISPLGT
jgi:hypothetical protein